MKGYRIIIHLFCILVLGISSSHAQRSAKLLKTTFASKDVFQSAYFLENRNILPDDGDRKILYYTNHDNISAAFTEAGILYKVTSALKNEREKDVQTDNGKEEQEGIPVRTRLVRMEWVGANPHAAITAGELAQGYYTYVQKNGTEYKTIITYGHKTIRYHDLYPGIDVEYSFPEKGGMEYTLFVQPGADVSKVKMQYSGATEDLYKDASGNTVIHTEAGDIVEHAPVSFSANGNVISEFEQKGNHIQFSFPKGYDTHETLTIDPWVKVLTTLPPRNMGFDVDYDFSGNLFAYGAGPTAETDIADFFEITKFDINGNVLWTFNGSVPSVPWNTTGGDGDYSYPSNIIVDKVTGKVYTGKGYDALGTTVIRLNSDGVYDSFISNTNSDFQETWGFAYRCSSGQILALGGGTSSNLNMGVIDTTSGVTTTSNITEIPTTERQDIVAGTYDTAGNLYVLLNCYTVSALPFPNTLYKVNSSFNGNVWSANTGYSPFQEALNSPYWYADGVGSSYNWFNALAANASYLYYYDGYHLAAYNLTSGAVVGNPDSITTYTPMYQGGIAVDNCNNVYVGGIGAIKTFSFDSVTGFTSKADISLGTGFQGDTVHDIKYNSTNNLLYVTGGSFAGTYTASLSTTCIVAATYTVATATNCDTATVTVTPGAGLNPLIFNYIWSDTAGNIISQLNTTPDTANTITGLQNGTYYVQVQWNSNCGGLAVSQTVVINCTNGFTAPTAGYASTGSACLGGCIGFKNESFNATSYQWYFPGGTPPSDTTTDPANICYDSVGTYNVTLIAYNAHLSDTLVRNASISIFPSPKDTIIRQGDSLIAPSGLSTYQWLLNSDSINNATSQVYIPAVSGSYSVEVTDSNGCSATSAPVTIEGISNIPQDITAEVYPNPLLTGNWNLLVGNALIGSTVEIFDATGNKVHQFQIVNQRSQIDLNIAPGVYFMHINSAEYTAVRKLIKL